MFVLNLKKNFCNDICILMFDQNKQYVNNNKDMLLSTHHLEYQDMVPTIHHLEYRIWSSLYST